MLFLSIFRLRAVGGVLRLAASSAAGARRQGRGGGKNGLFIHATGAGSPRSPRFVRRIRGRAVCARGRHLRKRGGACEAAHLTARFAADVDTLVDRRTATALKEDFDRVTRVVADLLRAAQLDSIAAGDGDRCDIAELAVEAAGFLLPLAERHGQELQVIGAERPVLVHANKIYALQALRNLVENAIFHTPTGMTITIRVAGDTVSVADSGPGIPDAQKDKIFQRFWRARRTGSGSGIGLAIVKRTMEIYGGRVEVTDTPGGGATFTLHFRPETAPPRAPDDAPPPGRRALETIAARE